jgi:hypothetical protein
MDHPLSMAYDGDVTHYERRKPILGRYLTGQISGQLFGQAAGGVLGDLFGWRNVFFVLAAMFALATAGLLFELLVNPRTRAARHSGETAPGFIAGYRAIFSNPSARLLLLARSQEKKQQELAIVNHGDVEGCGSELGAAVLVRSDHAFRLHPKDVAEDVVARVEVKVADGCIWTEGYPWALCLRWANKNSRSSVLVDYIRIRFGYVYDFVDV